MWGQTRTHLYGKKSPIGKIFKSPPPPKEPTQGSENFAQNVGPWGGGGLYCKSHKAPPTHYFFKVRTMYFPHYFYSEDDIFWLFFSHFLTWVITTIRHPPPVKKMWEKYRHYLKFFYFCLLIFWFLKFDRLIRTLEVWLQRSPPRIGAESLGTEWTRGSNSWCNKTRCLGGALL